MKQFNVLGNAGYHYRSNVLPSRLSHIQTPRERMQDVCHTWLNLLQHYSRGEGVKFRGVKVCACAHNDMILSPQENVHSRSKVLTYKTAQLEWLQECGGQQSPGWLLVWHRATVTCWVIITTVPLIPRLFPFFLRTDFLGDIWGNHYNPGNLFP